MEEAIQRLFERYQRLFQQALRGEVDMDEVASSYATSFIAASPAGVGAGANDAQLQEQMQQGFAYYRQIGTKEMLLRRVDVVPIDDLHCLARVTWTATYDRGDAPDVAIDFEVHYLVQQLGDTPRIFGWITGDEQAVLQKHGIV